jgi:hypothetical protein
MISVSGASWSCYLCQTHLFSSKGESSFTVEVQIGGAAAPEFVWRSRIPAKHALNLIRFHSTETTFIQILQMHNDTIFLDQWF